MIDNVQEAFAEVRKMLKGTLIQCHDCRMMRDAMMKIIDAILPEGVPSLKEREINVPTIRAHSEIVMKDPIVRLEKGDGMTVEHTSDRKIT